MRDDIESVFGHSLTLFANGVEIAVRIAGQGPALLMLHGFPQNHRCWGPVWPEFTKHFTCIAPDLRGYGDSAVVPDDEGHTAYSKSTMALDMVGILDALQIKRAHVLGHDRGARVAYRMALNHPERVGRVGILEILPTSDYWRLWKPELALKAYHWTFLAQPAPFPEWMISGNSQWFADWTLASWTQEGRIEAFASHALESYRAQFADPDRVSAMCADYRAGAHSDRAQDEADRIAGKMIAAPVHVLCGDRGFPATCGNIEEIWGAWANRLTVSTCSSGHFVPEENPDAVIRSFVPYFAEAMAPA